MYLSWLARPQVIQPSWWNWFALAWLLQLASCLYSEHHGENLAPGTVPLGGTSWQNDSGCHIWNNDCCCQGEMLAVYSALGRSAVAEVEYNDSVAAAAEMVEWPNALAEGPSERMQLEYFEQYDTSAAECSRIPLVPFSSFRHDEPLWNLPGWSPCYENYITGALCIQWTWNFYGSYITLWTTTLVVNSETNSQRKLVQKLKYYSSGFPVFQKKESL